jgi:hypothetical protein
MLRADFGANRNVQRDCFQQARHIRRRTVKAAGVPEALRLQRVLMIDFPRCSVVVTYDEDRQQLILQAVDPARLAPLLAKAIEAPILLDEFDFSLDDEFVRRFGGGLLNLISLGQPELKQYMTFTPHPIDRLAEE